MLVDTRLTLFPRTKHAVSPVPLRPLICDQGIRLALPFSEAKLQPERLLMRLMNGSLVGLVLAGILAPAPAAVFAHGGGGGGGGHGGGGGGHGGSFGGGGGHFAGGGGHFAGHSFAGHSFAEHRGGHLE